MKTEKFQIRKLKKFSKVLQKELSALLAQLSLRRSSVSENILRKALKNPNTHLFGLFVDKKLVGTGTLIVMNTFASERGYVHDLVVDKNHRGKGLAQEIMKEIIKTAKKLKLLDLELSSSLHRKTEEFFPQFGFEKRETNCFRLEL